MPTPSYNLRCKENIKIAEGIWQFKLEKPEELQFEAGQFVLFDAPLKDNPADIQTRAFSIASSPLEKDLLFVAKMIEGGRASIWIEKMLKAGDKVRTQGPFGRFLLNEKSPKEYLFICTGSGIAPFRSQIVTALKKGDKRKMDLVFGTRKEDELFWMDELNELSNKFNNFTVHTVLSKPGDKWKGLCGHVQDIVPSIQYDLSNKQIYVCGNSSMTSEVKNCCLNDWGMGIEDLHVEGYQ